LINFASKTTGARRGIIRHNRFLASGRIMNAKSGLLKRGLIIAAILSAGGGAFFAWSFLAVAQTCDSPHCFGINWHTATGEQIRQALADGALSAQAKDNAGVTPLHIAASRPAGEAILTALLEAGAEVNAKENESGLTPLHTAVINAAGAESVAVLLSGGADIAAKTNDGYAPLHLAAERNPDSKVVVELLSGGADVAAKIPGGFTPLHLAAAYNPNLKIIAALLAGGADINPQDDGGNTPLDFASANQKEKTRAMLIKNGAHCNTRCREGDARL
jgi:ankyrin repeat protein